MYVPSYQYMFQVRIKSDVYFDCFLSLFLLTLNTVTEAYLEPSRISTIELF